MRRSALASISLALGTLSLPAAAQEKVWEQHGESDWLNLGTALRSIDDVDGDGVRDLVVGARSVITRNVHDGKVRLYSGADGALRWSIDGPDRSPAQGSNGFGSVLGTIDDLDGDGRDDVLVGAPGENSRDPRRLVSVGAVFVLSGTDGSPIHTVRGLVESEFLGTAVCGLGDVDGDGTPDFAASAPNSLDAQGLRRGTVRLYSGADASILFEIPYDLGDATRHAGSYGSALEALADVTGDGVTDLLVATRHDSDLTGTQYAGSVAAYSGADGRRLWRVFGVPGDFLGSGLASIPDWNLDGIADVLIGAPQVVCGVGHARVVSGADGATLQRWDGSLLQRFGSSVSGAGDVDGDGRQDLLVSGARFWSGCGDVFQAGPAHVELISGRGHRLYTWDDFSSMGFAAMAVTAMGDIDGDGLDDVAFGVDSTSVGTSGFNGRGWACAFAGSASWLWATPKSPAPNGAVVRCRVGDVPDARRTLMTLRRVEDLPFFHRIKWYDVPAGQDFVEFLFTSMPPAVSGLELGFRAYTFDARGKVHESQEEVISVR